MDILETGRAILATQPFSVLLGAELTAFREGHAEITVPIRDDLQQQHGFAHGGVLAYLADNAMTFAGGTVLPNVLTSEIKVNYVRPALGQLLIARAVVVASGQLQAVCRCDIFAVDDGAEKLCAAAQGTITKRPASKQT